MQHISTEYGLAVLVHLPLSTDEASHWLLTVGSPSDHDQNGATDHSLFIETKQSSANTESGPKAVLRCEHVQTRRRVQNPHQPAVRDRVMPHTGAVGPGVGVDLGFIVSVMRLVVLWALRWVSCCSLGVCQHSETF